MMIRVPFRLRRRAGAPAPSVALFVPGRDASELLALCTRLGVEPTGRVHDVAGGFLLRLADPASGPLPGVTRLRETAPDLFVPVDAELVPALLDDEAAGLVRDGGLVILPGPRALRFDRTATVEARALLAVTPSPRRAWRALPSPRRLADRLVEVSREWPEPAPDDLYREMGRDVRRRRRPRSGPPHADVDAEGREGDPEGAGGEAAGADAGERQGLGEALRGLVGRAGSGARSLGEAIRWGMLDHSSLVRKLLSEFREGDSERALRHALSMAPADSRSPQAAAGGRLPFSRAIYNLMDLLGGPRRGGVTGVWSARLELMEELRREYLKAAERALARGDFRRAAYIHGKLLGDDRQAAMALQRGGLHHDAAILYLKKVNDKAAAARAFEAAGMVERALGLYRDLGQHEAAGDLLRRIGDEPAALDQYVLASIRAGEASPPNWLEAGRILARKAGLIDPALEAYASGWAERPAANASACALELVAIHATRAAVGPLRALLDEADAFYEAGISARVAGAFYNRIAAAVAAAPVPPEFAEEVRDRARTAMAGQLRRQVEAGRPPGSSVSSLFGESTLWPSAFVRDAQFAASAAAARRSRSPSPADGSAASARAQDVRVGHGIVTAACQSSPVGELFLGFADGKIFAYQSRRGRVIPIHQSGQGPIAAMAADPEGGTLVALRYQETGAVVASFVRQPDGTYRGGPEAHFPRLSRPWLTPMLSLGAQTFVGLGEGDRLAVLDVAAGLVPASITLPTLDESPGAAFLLPHGETFRVLTHEGPRWVLLDQEGHRLSASGATWRPAGGARPARCAVPLSASCRDGLFKVVGLDEHGAVHASQIWIEEGVLELLSSPVASAEGGYLAATQAGPSRVAAVSAERIDWLSDGSDRFQVVQTLPSPNLARTVACFPTTATHEAFLVSSDGLVWRVEAPRSPRRP